MAGDEIIHYAGVDWKKDSRNPGFMVPVSSSPVEYNKILMDVELFSELEISSSIEDLSRAESESLKAGLDKLTG